MFQLPKGNPLFENLAVSKLKLPDVVSKLSSGSFTGYVNFSFLKATGILVFESGKMVSTTVETSQGTSLNGVEAITFIADKMIDSVGDTMSVYRLSKDLTMCVHALMSGENLYRAQELALIDIKTLLERISREQMNGCLRIYTEERSAMIFYKEGTPLGFFHDGSQDIDSSPGESQQLAQDPKAKLDLYTTTSADELMSHDLLEIVNIDSIWNSAISRKKQEQSRANNEREQIDRIQQHNRFSDLENQIRNTYVDYVGNVGKGIIDKELTAIGGINNLSDQDASARFLTGLEKAAKLLVNLKKTTEIKNKIKDILEKAQA